MLKSPQRGVLYFELPKGREEAVRKEWTELKRLAGSGQAFGFTRYWDPNPVNHSLLVTVHTTEDLGSPEPYPLERGIVKTDPGESPDFRCVINQLQSGAKQSVVAAACNERSQ
jgi:hypothetical protein